jgi:hypothetical protein
LHFTYVTPNILQPIPTASVNIHPANPNPNEFMLFAARQGSEPFGIVMIAEKLHVTTAHNSTGFKDGADFLRRIAPGVGPDSHMKVLGNKHFTNADGLIVDELDYQIENEYDSGIAIEIGQYLVVFKCNAKSVADLTTMTKSALATRQTK